MKLDEKFNKWFSICIVAGMAVCVVLTTMGKLAEPGARVAMLVISAFGALCGVASTVLSANGSIWNFLFGLIDVSIYAYMLYDSKLPSQFLLHICYILPMEVVAFFQWRKKGADSKAPVKPQRMHGGKFLKYGLLFVGVFAVAVALDWFGMSKTSDSVNYARMALDAAVTTANIVALVMMAFAYVEQWYLWLVVNVTSVVLWTITLLTTPDAGYAVIPLVKYSFYLLNALNGLRVWYGLSRREPEVLEK